MVPSFFILDWESLYSPLTIRLDEGEKLHAILSFDENYKVSIECLNDGMKSLFMPETVQLGGRIMPRRLTGVVAAGELQDYQVTARGVYFYKSNSSIDSTRTCGHASEISIEIPSYVIEKGKASTRIVEHCICGPEYPLAKPVAQSVVSEQKKTVKWEGNEGKRSENFAEIDILAKDKDWKKNSFVFEHKSREFILTVHDSPSANEAPFPTSVFYPASIPSSEVEERRKCLEAFSVVLGTKFLQIGSAECHESGLTLKANWFIPPSYFYRKHGGMQCSPFWFRDYEYSQETANELFGQFIEKCQSYDLQNIMLDYWLARTMPFGVDIVLYATALEKLVRSWHRVSTGPSSLIDKEDFNVLKKSVNGMIDKAGYIDEEIKSKFKSKVGGMNNLGTRDLSKSFFKAHNLEIGPLEHEAMIVRNKYAHGANHFAEDPEKTVQASNSYRTLFNRSILSVLEHKGEYVDYSATGYPLKALNTKQGG